MKTSSETNHLRLTFYYKLETYIQTHIGYQSVEKFMDEHRSFSFSNGALIFAKFQTSALSKSSHRYIPVGINNPYRINSIEPEDLRKFKLLFPFINYYLNEFNTYVGDVWYKSEELLRILPTRNNIIDNLLETL